MTIWILAILCGAAMMLVLWPAPNLRVFSHGVQAGNLSSEYFQVWKWHPWRRQQPVTTAQRRQFLTQIAALLKAGRQQQQVWAELDELYSVTDNKSSALAQFSRQASTLAARGENPGQIFAQHWPVLSQCLELSASHGVPLAELLERYSHHLQADQELDELIRIESAGPKMTQKLLLFLPLGGVGLCLLLGLDIWHIYFGHPLGVLCIVAGAVLSFLGARTTGRIIAEAGRRT